MSDVQAFLLQFDRHHAAASQVAAETAKKLEERQVKLLDLIQSLGEYLNNDDAAIRSKTMAFLAEVLEHLSPKVLSRQQRDLLTDFILSRISNGAEGLGHCARGLQSLENMSPFDAAKVETVIQTLFDYTSPLVQFKQQGERYPVLTFIDLLLSKHRNVLQSLHDASPEFMPRFIELFDGEKDPRNLMVIFSILKVPMVEWDISANAQELFEAVFNYFPITFRPPPDDPYGITAQDLKDRLRECIAANGHFAPHSFPALLDKLDSTSANVKRDSLQAISSCAKNYGPATMNLYSVTLWDALKFEVFNAQEEDLAEEALSSLYQIARTLSTSSHEGPVQNFVKPIAKECNEHLEDAPTKQSSASGRILYAVTRTSAEVSFYLLKAVLPQIHALYKSADSIQKRRGLLEVLNKLIDANVVLFGRWLKADVSEEEAQDILPNTRPAPNAFMDHATDCHYMLLAALTGSPVKEVSYRLTAVEGLRELATINKLLDNTTISELVTTLDNIVINEESYGRDEVKAAAMDALVVIARQKPQLVIEAAVPAFMAQLPDNDQERKTPYMPVLEAFAKLSAEPQIFSTVTVRLRNKLYAALRSQASRSYCVAILSAIFYGFSNGSVDVKSPTIFGQYYSDLILPLLKDICGGEDDTLVHSPANEDEDFLSLIGLICNVILRQQPWVSQTEICRNIYTLFRPVDTSSIPPFAQDNSRASRMTVSTYLLASLQVQASPDANVQKLLRSLVDYARNTENMSSARNAALQQIALLANKFIPSSQVADVLLPYFDGQASLIGQPQPTLDDLRVAFALLKALTFRADGSLSALVPRFLKLLSQPALGAPCAHAFASILAPSDLLTKENHCTIRALHKQRFFTLSVPALVENYRNAAQAPETGSEELKKNTLIALTGTLQHVPYELIQPELSKLVPLLLQSLALEDMTVNRASLALLGTVVTRDARTLEEHVSSLVNRLLEVATKADRGSDRENPSLARMKLSDAKSAPDGSDPQKIRTAALACLRAFVGNLREEVLVPHQKRITKQLSRALDDPKRSVRAEAVKCRAAWQGIDAGDDDDDD